METLSGHRASQEPLELAQLRALMIDSGVRRYLEIGARHGDTFYCIMTSLPKGSFGIAVDLPGGAWGKLNSRYHLLTAIDRLKADYSVKAILGDSGSREVIDEVHEAGPFDLILIDGDHSYEGVKRDFENYRKIGKMIAFHDIAGEGVRQRKTGQAVEVPRLWREIKRQSTHILEFIAPNSKMGIGVLIQ